MEVLFLMGAMAGFFLGLLFATFYTQIITHRIMAILKKYNIPKPKPVEDCEKYDVEEVTEIDDEINDPVNYWKPKGWKPEED